MKARQEAELSGATKNIVISDDLEKSAQERVDMFYSFVKVCSGFLVIGLNVYWFCTAISASVQLIDCQELDTDIRQLM